MEILIEILRAIAFVGLSCLSIILFFLGWRILKCPEHIWEANRKNPNQQNFNRLMEAIKGE